jgi:hypothetical protein
MITAPRRSIADRFNIPLGVFEDNNYCVDLGSSTTCPPFNDGTVSFWILVDKSIILSLLLTGCVHCEVWHWETPEVWENLLRNSSRRR